MPFIEQLAQQMGGQAAGNFVNEAFGLISQPLKNKQQVKQQARLNQVNSETAKHLAEFNYNQQMKMWNETNYKAQVEQLKKAGLNPGLLYGMGGAGGATTNAAQASGGSGGGAGVANASRGAEGMGLQIGQMGLLEANKALTEAQTRKTNIEADKIAGVDTEEGKTRISEASKRIEALELSNEYNRKSLEDRLDLINSVALKEVELLTQAQTQTGLDRATVLQKAEQIKQEAIGAQLRNLLTKAQTTNTQQSTVESKARIQQMKAQTDKWAAEIAQGWAGLSIQDKRLRLDGIFKQMEVEQGYDWRGVRYEYNEKDFMRLIDKLMGGQ